LLAGEAVVSEPKLSIVLATRNGVRSVRGLMVALTSFSRSNHEIVVVDNGSSDGTLELLRSFATLPEITLVENGKNLGRATALNQGVALARGEYILGLCSRHALPTFIGWDEPLVRWMNTHAEVDLAGELRTGGPAPPSLYFRPGWRPGPRLASVQGGAWIARRSVFDELGGFAEPSITRSPFVELSWRIQSYEGVVASCPLIASSSWPDDARSSAQAVVVHPASHELRARVRRQSTDGTFVEVGARDRTSGWGWARR
jgi:hypothetical protein